MPSLNGDISLMPVGDLFLWVANRQLSLTMEMALGQFDRKFVVRDGLVSQASASDPREYLGQHLINFGHITEDQLQKAFDTQKETQVPLGRVLVMVGAVTDEQLKRVLLFKARESLLEAMCWTEGQFKATTDVPPDELDADIPVNLLEVHSEGVARARMWEEMRRVFPTDATRCDVLVEVRSDASAFDRRLIELLREGCSVGETGLELRSMDFQIYARLYDLYNRQVIRPRLATVSTAPKGSALPPDEGLEREGAEEEGFGSIDIALDSLTGGDLPADDLSTEGAAVEEEVINIEDVGAIVDVPEPGAGARRVGEYSSVRVEAPEEAPGVEVPAEAQDPTSALRIALAGRNWGEALLLAERILQMDPQNTEAVAARRVAEAQVRKLEAEGANEALDLGAVPRFSTSREDIAKGHLTSKERYVLSRIDGKRTLAQIAAVSPIQRTELVRIVSAFESRGVVELGK